MLGVTSDWDKLKGVHQKKTGMAEECRQSGGKRALRACTECGILLGVSGVLSKAV